MSGPLKAPPVIILISIISSDDGLKEQAAGSLEGRFGRIHLTSPSYPFDLSDYYKGEMGGGLTRRWCSFSSLQCASFLVDWKLACASIEMEFSDIDSNRKVNIDPGYMDFGKLVLASFKSAPDKIYMGSGVWAHTCLRYGHGGFTAPDHSFPDFKDGRFNRFMLEVRGHYRKLLGTQT